jgi:23S rRNA pseudouridine1911/1915/1917 synthase
VDRVLLRHLRDVPGLSRTKIQRLIDAGAVLLNDEPAPRAAWRIADGDRLSVHLPQPVLRQRPQPEAAPLDIVFEDDDFIVHRR